MSRPQRLSRRAQPPTLSAFSFASSAGSCGEEEHAEGGSSPILQNLFASFQDKHTFCQLDEPKGRERQIISQTTGLLHHIWASRDSSRPELCFDKHDGRSRSQIYDPPKRIAGGVVLPCTLSDSSTSSNGFMQNVNIVHNHVVLNSTQNAIQQAVHGMNGGDMKVRDKIKRSEQLTFTRLKASNKNWEASRKGNRGRFVRENLVTVMHKRETAPSIPLNTKSLRRLLMKWVIGDKDIGLQKPLGKFTSEEMNGRDRSGKINKPLFSRRRAVATAVLLALQDAYENKRAFKDAIGLNSDEEMETITMSKWEKIAKRFLKIGRHRLTDSENICLSKKIYHSDALKLLPHNNG